MVDGDVNIGVRGLKEGRRAGVGIGDSENLKKKKK